MKPRVILAFVTLVLLSLPALAETPWEPPEGAKSDFGFDRLDKSTMNALLDQGSLIIVRHKPDMTLINVSGGQVIHAPASKVWEVITDFEHYPDFMPQTSAEKVLEKEDNHVLVEQSIEVKIWRLPAVSITYNLAQELDPPHKVRFWHVGGQLEGTYGGWDLIEAGNKTLAFYTLYSNLNALGWGLGGIFKSQPDFLTGVNMTTVLMVSKAVKEESERRASQ